MTQSSPQESFQNTEDTFERLIEQLQSTVRRLESGELSMDESLKSFELGVQLARKGQLMLSDAEQKVELLMQANADGNVQTRAFQVPDAPADGTGGPRS
jgi:exodeoxyribonuclease VII small subunit